jgi:hypothetical protein
MGSHVAMRRAEDLKIVVKVLHLLLKDEGGSDFMASDDYVMARRVWFLQKLEWKQFVTRT